MKKSILNALARSLPPFVLLALILGNEAEAQISTGTLGSEIMRPSSASYYYIAKPNELSMQVNIWGFVRNPGRYEVATSTDLIKLLSYAGGPTQDAILDNVTVTRSAGRASGGEPLQYRVNLEEMGELTPEQLVLYPDDTVFIDHSGWLNVRDLFTVITVAAIVTGAVAQIVIASSR